MTAVIIISALTCVLLIAVILLKPSVKIKGVTVSIYWAAALIGAVVLLACGYLTWAEVGAGLTADTSINPLKILALFISMTVMSVFLDEVGFFEHLAAETLKKANSSQMRLFVCLYLTVSVLTVFTSNDIIILTFTPFICHFCKAAKINPVPYLVAEFVAANTWSMMLIIGNPTNIYLATACGIGFVKYFEIMALPTLFGGLTAFLVLLLVFYRTLKQPIERVDEDYAIKDKGLLIIGLVHLGACTVLLAVAGYIGLEMWLITVCFAGSMFLCVGMYSLIKKKAPKELGRCLQRAPWELIPFVLSMFVLVLALEKYGVSAAVANALNAEPILEYGAFSFALANLINNIPMSVFMSSVTQNAGGGVALKAVFASVVGSNIGAFLTPIGALAGIMWSGIIGKYEIKFGFLSFVKYGVIIAIPTLLATLGGLYLAFLYC